MLTISIRWVSSGTTWSRSTSADIGWSSRSKISRTGTRTRICLNSQIVSSGSQHEIKDLAEFEIQTLFLALRDEKEIWKLHQATWYHSTKFSAQHIYCSTLIHKTLVWQEQNSSTGRRKVWNNFEIRIDLSQRFLKMSDDTGKSLTRFVMISISAVAQMRSIL